MKNYSVIYKLSNGSNCYGNKFEASNISEALLITNQDIKSSEHLILHDKLLNKGVIVSTKHIVYSLVEELEE